jgi:hypothetical protein
VKGDAVVDVMGLNKLSMRYSVARILWDDARPSRRL